MRLVGALDAILIIIAFRRKQLCDLVDATCRAAAIDPRGVEHALADFELVIAQVILHPEEKTYTPSRWGPKALLFIGFMLNSITAIGRKGIIWRQVE